ncbi:TPA: RHS repeat protein, partial [Pasteurella multocida]|nr:RHS repeat protein [Pasteurella multocida]
YQLYEYDKDTQQLCAYRNVKGDKTQLQRDPFGRVTQMILPDKSQYHYEHSQAHANPAGSVTKIRTPEGSELHFRYNSERLLTESVNGNGEVTRYDYGAFDLLRRQTLPNGETLEFHYDKLTRLTEVKNAQGDRYCYVYDPAGQLIKETDFTGRSRGYHYDIAGRLIRTTHADGSVVTFHYNQTDQLTCRQVWQPQVSRKAVGQSPRESNVDSTDKTTAGLADSQSHYQLAHQIRYEYDKQSRQLVLSTNTQYHPFYAEHCTEFEYDAQYRLIAEIQDGERVETTLDRYGRQTTLTLPYWNAVEDKADTLAVHQTYNRYGELTDFQINGHQPLQFRYDKLGRQVCRQSAQGFILAEQFSPSGLLQAQGGGFHQVLTAPSLDEHTSLSPLHPNADFAQVNQPGLVGTQLSRQWQYDKAFNLTRIQDNHWGNTTYHSNKNGQITAVFNDVRDSEHYRYDSQLNLIEKSKQETNAYGEYLPPAANDSRYHIKQRQGRITRFGNKTYHYDSLGRLSRKVETKKGFRPVKTYYKWNSLHQLVELMSPYKGIWRYEYDSLGRRVSKYRIQTEQPTGLSQISLPVRANHRDYWSQIHKLWDAQEQAHSAQGQGAQTPTDRQAAYPEQHSTQQGTQHSTQQGYRYLYHRDQLVAEAPMERRVQGNLALAQS